MWMVVAVTLMVMMTKVLVVVRRCRLHIQGRTEGCIRAHPARREEHARFERFEGNRRPCAGYWSDCKTHCFAL